MEFCCAAAPENETAVAGGSAVAAGPMADLGAGGDAPAVAGSSGSGAMAFELEDPADQVRRLV